MGKAYCGHSELHSRIVCMRTGRGLAVLAIILFHPMAGRTTEIVMEVSNSALYKLARLAGRSTNGQW